MMINVILKDTLRFLYCIVFVFVSMETFAQTDDNPSKYLPNIIPPSPEAYKLGTYGNTPIGLFTGSPNVKIPLLSFRTKNLNVAFEISYTSNGIKVDDVNSKVGLGWNLIGEGIITRVIRDQPDEIDSQIIKPTLGLDKYMNPEFLAYFQTIGENPDVDSESDVFNYNFNNYSGKFIADENGYSFTMPKSDLKIESYYNPLSPDIFNFKITTNDGVIYYFEEKEQTMLRTSGEGHAEPSMNYTSWYLTKIVHPQGDEIYLTYVSDGSYYVASQRQQLTKSYPSYQYEIDEAYSKTPTFSIIYSHHTRVVGKKIQSVTSNNPTQGSMQFEYQDIPINNEEPNTVVKEIVLKNQANEVIEKVNFSYLTTANNRFFLEQISFKDINKKYGFEYIQPNNFPLRLSKGQDHWGYYNGANNTHLIPNVVGYGFENINYYPANKEPNSNFSKIGMMSKVTYPTKGRSEIIYEGNNYYGFIKTLPPKKYSLTLNVNTDDEVFNAQSIHNLSVLFDQNIELRGGSYFYNCDAFMDAGAIKHKSIASVFCVEDNSLVPLFSYDQFGEERSIGLSVDFRTAVGTFYFRALKGKNYTINLRNNFNCTRGYLGITYYNQNYTESYTNISAGGHRVRKIIDYNFDSKIVDSKTYHYSKINQLNISSGDEGASPFYIDFKVFRKAYSSTIALDGIIAYKEFQDIVITSSSLSNLYNNGNNVFYKYVSISHSGENFENGGEEKEFVVNRDYQGNPLYNSKDIRSAPYTNFGWNNGLEINSKVFKKLGADLSIISQTENFYVKDDTKTVDMINYASRKNFDNIIQKSVAYTCTSNDIVKLYYRNICTTNHKHNIWMHNYHCIAFGANNQKVAAGQHACFGHQVNEIITYMDELQNIDIVEYKNISYKFNLGSTKETNYFYNNANVLTGTITNTKTFNYSSPSHINLTSQTTTTSNNQTIETKYLYPDDLLTEPLMSDLKAANRIGTPIVTEQYKAGILVSKNKTIFAKDTSTSNLLLPKSIYAAKFPNINPNITLPAVGQLEKKITYDSYDNKGNILQYTLESGVPVSIIWGYNKTQPIAKIENATNAQIAAALSVANLNTINETNLTAINNLRTSTDVNLQKAMITSYTHIPLVGVSTITDPKGDKIIYTHDAFGRLQFVKDKTGNLLSENEYRYKN